MKANCHIGAGLCLAAILLAGCNGSGLATAKVKGKVTVAGQPVKDIVVTFTPAAGGRPASGITDTNGEFTLSTLSNGDGAVPGKHKVAFAIASTGEAPSSDPSAAAAAASASSPFNAKYGSGDTSGITADVVAGKTNELPAWDLEK